MNLWQTPTEPRRPALCGGVVVPCPGPIERTGVIVETSG